MKSFVVGILIGLFVSVFINCLNRSRVIFILFGGLVIWTMNMRSTKSWGRDFAGGCFEVIETGVNGCEASYTDDTTVSLRVYWFLHQIHVTFDTHGSMARSLRLSLIRSLCFKVVGQNPLMLICGVPLDQLDNNVQKRIKKDTARRDARDAETKKLWYQLLHNRQKPRMLICGVPLDQLNCKTEDNTYKKDDTTKKNASSYTQIQIPHCSDI